MKKTLMLLSAAASLAALTPTSAEANSSIYAGPIGGANWIQTNSKHSGATVSFDTGYDVGGFVGYHFCSGINVEAEFIYRRNDIKSVRFGDESFDGSAISSSSGHSRGHFQSMSYMANFIYDISLPSCYCWSIFPYVGAGIGYEQEQLKFGDLCGCNSRDKKNGFGWQVLAGIAYAVNCNFDVAIDYHFNQGRASRIYNHSLSLAAAYQFSL